MRTDRIGSDAAFVAAFEDMTLDPGQFGHRGHLRLAWIQLGLLPLDEAIQRCSDSIRRFASHHGSPEKFHLTLTVAFICLIHNRMQGAPAGEPFEAFCLRNPDLIEDARGLIARHYSEARLAEPAARIRFIAPDRQPLP